ncbi:MAG: sigma 54-interacting transcriptional regulator, partial [Myxococcota bacterium]|nr:sigma 54-interacting transcriptional regulator [Myxococcota bacterium]
MVLSDVPTTRSPASNRPEPDVAAYVVTVLAGPDRGKCVRLDGSSAGRVLVGQSRLCDLHLTDRQISRRHLALEATGRGLRVTDLGSTNGTKSASVAVVDAYFGGGEQIVIGESILRIEAAPARGTVPLTGSTRFGRVFGGSDAMRKLYPLCERLAASSVPVVIEGETGTGKELLAEAFHEEGPRADGPFIVFDCTAVSPALVESTLFGHERGAFTNAVALRKGVFELADGGTLLIDEVGELEPALQPKLLRALERGEVQRVGGEKWIKVDVRVEAATRRDLDAEVQAGRFREDLYYRLAVGRIELPPLRDRHGDVGLLARHFWRKLDTADQVFPAELAERLEAYRWPGNVRELRNAIARRLALGDIALGPRSASGAAAQA